MKLGIRAAALFTLSAALLGACATMAAPPTKVEGGVLVGSNGMTLYTFDKDTPGKSVCNGQCATNWPPLMAADADAASGDYSLVTRDDGKPLYTYIEDKKAGDMVGDGKGGVWHVAKAD